MVETADECCTRTRELSPVLPKRVPSKTMLEPPEDALQTRFTMETVGSVCTASVENKTMALDATVKARREIFPDSDARRHVAQVSLVHNEPEHEDIDTRVASEGATLANDLPNTTT